MNPEKEVIDVTCGGLNLYAHILNDYYPNEIVLEVNETRCQPARNPFNDHKRTLTFREQEGVFFYQDLELPDFKGNPLDFAYLHYGLTGPALLERIVKDMYLVVGPKPEPASLVPEQVSVPLVEEDPARFSFFHAPISNVIPGPQVTLRDVYRGIKSKHYEFLTQELRMITDPEARRKFKARRLDYVCFSGTFSRRSDQCLIRHSGLINFDLDHVTNPAEVKQILLNDPFFETELLFVSPSGAGVKWIVPIDLNYRSHLDWFNGISGYLEVTYGLVVDPSGKDVSRACFLCWDPEVYIHPKYLVKASLG